MGRTLLLLTLVVILVPKDGSSLSPAFQAQLDEFVAATVSTKILVLLLSCILILNQSSGFSVQRLDDTEQACYCRVPVTTTTTTTTKAATTTTKAATTTTKAATTTTKAATTTTEAAPTTTTTTTTEAPTTTTKAATTTTKAATTTTEDGTTKFQLYTKKVLGQAGSFTTLIPLDSTG